jgi:lipid II:glycine glycyltransferase (peptidoglycan interpeptide bridge formation enzyme)
VNLENSWKEIVKGFSSQNRRNARKAEKSGLEVHIDQSELAWKSFAEIYQKEMIRKNAPSHLRFSNQFFERLSRMNDFTLLVITSEEKIIGGFISAHGAKIAHHYLSAVQHDQWAKRPNNILYTKVLKYFWEKGYKLFDFQGGRKGVFRFKMNFSKLRGEFYVASCIYDRRKFNELTERAGVSIDEHFPPYRIP